MNRTRANIAASTPAKGRKLARRERCVRSIKNLLVKIVIRIAPGGQAPRGFRRYILGPRPIPSICYAIICGHDKCKVHRQDGEPGRRKPAMELIDLPLIP